MITLFTTTKPFIDNNAIIQTNALKSWTHLHPECEIIVFGDSSGTREVCMDLDIVNVPKIQCNKFGTPLLNDLFKNAKKMSKFNTICYVNADIILMSDFIDAIKIITKKEKKFMMIGQRWDYNLSELIDFTGNWEQKLRETVIATGQLHAKTGIDYFVFNSDLLQEIPPFAIGRTAWDNWLLYAASNLGAKVIDASHSVMCIHQNHNYSHISGGEKAAWDGEEAMINQALAQGHVYTIDDAGYCLLSNKISINIKNIIKRQGNEIKGKIRSFIRKKYYQKLNHKVKGDQK